MNIPEKNKKHSSSDDGGGGDDGGIPTTNVEGSPVFNFMNSVSPLKPAKPAPMFQMFNSFNLSFPHCIFTSPHHVSNRKSRYLNRHQSPNSAVRKLDFEYENRLCCNLKDSAQVVAAVFRGDFDPEEALSQSPGKQFKTGFKLPISSTKNYYGNPDGNATSRCDTEAVSASELPGMSKEVVPVDCGTSGKVSENNLSDQENCGGDQDVERICADWDYLISYSVDVLKFCSPTKAETSRGLMPKNLESDASFGTSNMPGYSCDDKNHVPDSVGHSKEHETAGPFSQYGKSIDLPVVDPTHGNLGTSNVDTQVAGSLSENTENERVTRRRFLDSDMAGGNGYVESNGSNASSFSQSVGMVTHIDKQLVPVKPGTDTSRCALPGIGLHLNAIGATLKGYKYMKHETFYARNQQPKVHSTISSDSAIPAERDSLKKCLASASSEKGIQDTENGTFLGEQGSEYLANEECNPTIRKKKRRKVEAAGEPEACKRCTCKKSKCLKLYCECFLAGVYCTEPCSCQNCFNKPIYEDTVLAARKQIESRNPSAFAPKVITDNTPSSARHKRGCNCKKSGCLKKYCECYQGGVGCSIHCRCEGCMNVFGRKGGSDLIGKHAEPEVEPETHEKREMLASAHAATPLQLGRPPVQLPSSSNGRPPRSTSSIIGSSSGLHASHKLGKPELLQPRPGFDNQLQSVPGNEMPKVLQDKSSPGSGVNISSPKRKRVSPPSCDTESSPARPSHKLILQSIPPFPSLSQN